jgi:hypothetical protein
MSVLMLCGTPNSMEGNIASFSIMASIAVFAFFLGSLFKLYTGKNFGEIDYNFYFKESNSSNRKEKSPE